MQEGVAGQGVGVGLGAALRVDGAGDIAELAEEVVAVEHDDEAAFEEGTRETAIPHPFVGVHRRVYVATARVEGHVGAQLQLPGQGKEGGERGLGARHVEVFEVWSAAVQPLPRRLGFQPEAMLGQFVVQLGHGAEAGGDDGAALQRRGAREVYAVRVSELWPEDEVQPFLLVERCGEGEPQTAVPVAVDVVGLVGLDARLRVEEAAHGQGVMRVVVVGTGIEVVLLAAPPVAQLNVLLVGVSERGIALVDVQRVGGIVDVHQVVQARGTGTQAIGEVHRVHDVTVRFPLPLGIAVAGVEEQGAAVYKRVYRSALIVQVLAEQAEVEPLANAPVPASHLGEPPEQGRQGVEVFVEVAAVAVGSIHRALVFGHGGQHANAVATLQAVEQEE